MVWNRFRRRILFASLGGLVLAVGVPIGVARLLTVHREPTSRPPLQHYRASVTVTLSGDGTVLHPSGTVLFDLSTAPLTVKPTGPIGQMLFVGSTTTRVLGRELRSASRPRAGVYVYRLLLPEVFRRSTRQVLYLYASYPLYHLRGRSPVAYDTLADTIRPQQLHHARPRRRPRTRAELRQRD